MLHLKLNSEGENPTDISKTRKYELTPSIQNKINEYFLIWLSLDEHQALLANELRKMNITFPSDMDVVEESKPLYKSSSTVDSGINMRSTSMESLLENANIVLSNSSSNDSINMPPFSPKLSAKSLSDSKELEKSELRTSILELKKLNNRNLFQEDLKEDAILEDSKPISESKLPQFYFPFGKPKPPSEQAKERQEIYAKAKEVFGEDENGISEVEFTKITEIVKFPRYLNCAMFRKCDSRNLSRVTYSQFVRFWKTLSSKYHDEISMMYGLLKQDDCEGLVYDDFLVILEDIVLHHPGLQFLSSLPLFQEKYVETVICRIFYSVNKLWDQKIPLKDLRRCNFYEVLKMVGENEDINKCRDFFSYKHFYVIYCKFWELDTDHDLFINFDTLLKYDNCAISSKAVDRIMHNYGNARPVRKSDDHVLMSYRQFIWFLISEENKTSTTAIEYWFRCLDTDGDGVISMFEMEYFYAEQIERMEKMMVEPINFHDCVCQMLEDVKKCQMAGVFFDMFFNISKFISFEQRDPMMFTEEGNPNALSPWDRFAESEYDTMAMEEDNEASQMSSLSDDQSEKVDGLQVDHQFGLKEIDEEFEDQELYSMDLE